VEDSQLSPKDKRRRILDAAVQVFSRNGFFNSKVAHVAREAGVADGTIYLYFKNKEDLLIQVFIDTMETALAKQEAALEGISDPVEKLQSFIHVHFDVVKETPNLAEVLTVELRQSAKFMRGSDLRLFGQYLGVIARIIEEGQEAGVFSRLVSSRSGARAVFGALDELQLEWATSEPAQPVSEVCGNLVELLLNGLRAR
jgi:TetR/AcrR family transcriptional regulator, fatty acid metabolism regulator protein